jgi:biotin synthase
MNKHYLKSLLRLPVMELALLANQARVEGVGERLDLCTILNAKSGLCAQDCKFCAQSSRHKTAAEVYPLKTKDQILKAALGAKKIGAQRFGIVTSGNRLSQKELRVICEAIAQIKKRVRIKVCASLGQMDKEDFLSLKKAGLSRYHHNLETSPRYFSRICTTHNYQDRVKTIQAAKEAGLEVCSGGIIGMGETADDRIEMAFCLKDLGVDSVPINILVPIAGTALAGQNPLSVTEAIRAIAIFRIILKDKTIKLAAGRESVLKDAQSLAFMAGANGMLIGGYLTIKGRDIKEDWQLIKEIKGLWQK